MNANGEQSFGPGVDRIVLLSAAHDFILGDMTEITQGSTFLYGKELTLQNVLLEAFAEMAFVVSQFQESLTDLLANGTPELANYIEQMNRAHVRQAKNIIIELHAFDLSTYFKSFLILAKAVLDKVVPFFSYRFNENLKTFSDKGGRLVNTIKHNKHVQKKTEFIALVGHVKNEWLDTLVDLRDEYTHFSNLRTYTNFWISGESIGQRKLTGIQDFHQPSILVAGNRINALDYMLSIKAELIRFLRDFLQLCEFTPDRRPKCYLACEECHHEFARKTKSDGMQGQLTLPEPINIQVKDRARDYGVIVCPKCGGQTDTDLQFWKKIGALN
jgi:hypothetical protein